MLAIRKFTTKKNVVIWFQSTKALTAIDIDSAGLKDEFFRIIFARFRSYHDQIRLRQISGIVVIGYATPFAKIERKISRVLSRICLV